MQPRPPIVLERLRRKVLGPLFDRLGYDLVPASPDWSHRPTSPGRSPGSSMRRRTPCERT
ncbi:hypothetical protein ACFQFG_24970 [Methylobacterium persicinum]